MENVECSDTVLFHQKGNFIQVDEPCKLRREFWKEQGRLLAQTNIKFLRGRYGVPQMRNRGSLNKKENTTVIPVRPEHSRRHEKSFRYTREKMWADCAPPIDLMGFM